MADINSTVDVLNKLKADHLESDWVKDVWDKDFTDFEPLPVNIEEEIKEADYYREVLKQARKILQPWSTGKEGPGGEGFWTVLVENELSHKSVVALLFYIMDVGIKRLSNAVQKEAGLAAAGVYFHIITVPGSGAFKVFHPMLYQKAVDYFKMWNRLGAETKKRKASPVCASQGRKGKSRKSKQNAEPERNEEDIFSDDEDSQMMTSQDIRKIRAALLTLLRDLVHLLENSSLADSEDSVQHTLHILAELAGLEPQTFTARFEDDIPVALMQSIPQLAYKGLTYLSSKHGDVTTMVNTTFKFLLPRILMLIGENKVAAPQTIPRPVQMAKDHARDFVCYQMQLHGDKVLSCVRTLLQHMCVKVPDKSDYRTKVAEAIVHILSKMPVGSYARMIEWLYRYSRNAKIGYRVFGLDVAALLLNEPERKTNDSVAEDMAVYLSHHFLLLEVMLARCSDIASTVRSRAIQGFAQCSSSTEPVIRDTIRSIVTPYRGGARGPLSRVIPTPDAHRTAPVIGQKDAVEGQTTGETSNQTIEGATALDKSSDGHQVADQAKSPAANIPNIIPGTVKLTPGGEITLADGQGVVSMLRRRAADEKVNVRKSALMALENVIRLTGDDLNKEDLAAVHDRCLDPALSVRKQALVCLTDLLLEMPENELLHMAWLDGALPMVLDRETGASEKCLEILEETLLHNIVPYPRSKDESHKLVWCLLEVLASNKGVDLRRFLQKACQMWGRAGKLKSSLISYLQTHINTENNAGAWMLLAELAPFVSKLPYNFVLEYWMDHASKAPESESQKVQRVLTVISYVAKSIPAEEIAPVAGELKDRIMRFDSPPDLVSVTVSTLNKLCHSQMSDKHAAKELTDTWFEDLLKACDSYLSRVILEEDHYEPLDQERIVRHLFTLGEIAQLCPQKTPKRVFMLVQSLIATPVITTIDGSTQRASSGFPSEVPTADNSEESAEVSKGSQEDSNSKQSSDGKSHQGSPPASHSSHQGSPPASHSSQFMPSSQLTQYSQGPLSQFRGSRMSSKVRAHAFLTLGKLCLQNEDIAKKCVAAMARELEISPDLAVRNNVVVILCDLCVRYTSVVDRYVPNISACLKDESPLIRKQTLTLLTHLLQEDFLKWKGSLFFRFVSCLVDEDDEIAKFAEFCLVHLLIQRHPTMFFHHFVESIFTFNGYEGHRVYNKFPQTERERKLFSFKGRNNASKRMKIYTLLLEHMADEHRFQLTAKLTQEVLGGVVDGIIPLDPETSSLVQDTLSVLSCKEIKLSSMRNKNPDDIVEEQDMAMAVMNVAKKTLISQVLKKNVIENVIPIVISLKHMLEKHHSPVQRDLMMYLRELMKDYKNEVQDTMSADRQLAKEIEFDLRKFEEEQEEAERRKVEGARRKSGAPPTPTAQTPQVSPRVEGTSGGRSPSVRRSSRPTTPVARVGTPKTPGGRNVSMSTLAILNSARKAVDKVRRLSEARASVAMTPQRAKKVGWADEVELTPTAANITSENISDKSTNSVEEDLKSAESLDDVFKTPKNNKKKAGKRAISTPAGNQSMLGNLTFAQDHNLSMIPMSPIPSSLPLRMYSNNVSGTPSLSSNKDQDSGQLISKADMIHMYSPDKPALKPRTWNVKSSGVAPKHSMISESSENEDPAPEKPSKSSRGKRTPKNTVSNDAAPGNESATRRSSRRSQAVSYVEEDTGSVKKPTPRSKKLSPLDSEDDSSFLASNNRSSRRSSRK